MTWNSHPASENEYQVWCKECWAHGPSMSTEGLAAATWSAISRAARGIDLKTDVTYVVVLDHPDGHCKRGDLVVFRWRTEDGKDNVFNPKGQSDMDSAFKINVFVTNNFVVEVERSG